MCNHVVVSAFSFLFRDVPFLFSTKYLMTEVSTYATMTIHHPSRNPIKPSSMIETTITAKAKAANHH